MSYILDALKKSEQERGNGNIPSVQTVHSSSLNYNIKKTYWPYYLIAAVLLNLLVIIYVIFDKEKKITINTAVNTPADISASSKKESSLSAADISNNQQGSDNQDTLTDIGSPPPIINNTTEDKSSPVATETINTVPVNDKDIIEFYNLPDSIKRQLPSIVISAHVYSTNPLQRSIVINNNFLEEGEHVLDDLILYEITRDGAIFAYHDLLIHHGVVRTWQ